MRTLEPESRNKRQLPPEAPLSLRDPRLPPVIRRLSVSVRGLGGIAKNSLRTGRPVTSVLPDGKYEAVSGNAISVLAAKRPRYRFVMPGTALGSMAITG